MSPRCNGSHGRSLRSFHSGFSMLFAKEGQICFLLSGEMGPTTCSFATKLIDATLISLVSCQECSCIIKSLLHVLLWLDRSLVCISLHTCMCICVVFNGWLFAEFGWHEWRFDSWWGASVLMVPGSRNFNLIERLDCIEVRGHSPQYSHGDIYVHDNEYLFSIPPEPTCFRYEGVRLQFFCVFLLLW